LPSPVRQFPADYAIVLVRSAQEQGFDLLERSTTSAAELEAHDYLPLSVYIELLERYTAVQTDPDWGFRLGQRLTMASHSALGFGAMTAPTIRDGLVFLARYLPTRTSYSTATIEQHGTSLHLLFRHDEVMLRFQQRICETLSLIFQSFIESAGAATTPLVWRFPYPPPANQASYDQWLHGGFTFEAEVLRLEVPGSVAMISSAFANKTAHQASLAQCEALLLEANTDTFTGKVRTILSSHIERRVLETVPVTVIPSASEIADHLKVSRRTLIRRLQNGGSPFQELKDELLRSQIESLLARTDLTLAEIGHRLGYADAANFTRACKRMYGATPRALRKRMLRDMPGEAKHFNRT
jgi:AraC-like DNA-binding protein